MKLPETIERDYMRFRSDIVRQVGEVAVSALHLRHDSEDDPELLALLALLGLTATTIINRQKLRAKLYRFAARLSEFERAQLTTLLGRYVHRPDPALIESWVDDQEEAITKSTELWLGRASVALGAAVVGGVGTALVTPERVRSAIAGSAALLALNAQLTENISTTAGATHYRWITKDDSVVRDNHRPLHFTIQAWDSPPAGGGTKPHDSGHPQSGFGCRCIAEPLIAPAN